MHNWKQYAGQEKNLGMGKVEKIGQSAGQLLKTKTKSPVNGAASEIAKVSGCEASLRYDPSPLGNFWVFETNFSMESIEQTFNGQADWGKKVTATVSRNGDLIHRTYLRVELPSVSVPATASGTSKGFRWLNWLGHILVKNVEVEIGGQRINNVGAEKYQAPMLICAA